MERTPEPSNDFGTLLRTLARNLRTGTVLARAGKRQKLLHLDEGVVKELYTRSSKFRIGDILFRNRSLEMAALTDALSEQKRTGRPIGEILIARGEITTRQLADAMAYRLVEEVLEIFHWKELRFEFLGESPERFVSGMRPALTRIDGEMDAEELVRRVEKIAADIRRFNEVTPSLRDVYELTADAAEYFRADRLEPGFRDFLLLLDGRRDMKDVLREMRMNRFDVLEFFYRLRIEGKIRAKNGFELLMLAENQKQELEPRKLLRLYERVHELGVEGFEVSRNLAELCVELEQPGRAAQYYVEMARRALTAGDSEGASEAAHRALELFPDDLELRRSLVGILHQAGREREGAEELRDLAGVLRDRGELAEAQQALHKAAEVLDDPHTREQLARVLLERGQNTDARRAFREAARLHAGAGAADSAVNDLHHAVEADPDHLGARLELAEALLHCDRIVECLHAISGLAGLAARLRPEGEEPRDILVRAADLVAPLGAESRDATAACARGLVILGDTENGRRLWAEVADGLLTGGEFPEAVVALREVLDLEPSDEETRETLARALTRADELTAAGEEWRVLAEGREEGNDLDGAARAWAELLTVCPFELDARERQARCTEMLGREEDAAVQFLELGDVLRIAGREDDAIEAFRHSRRLCRSEPRSLGRLISAFEGLGLKDAGIEVRRALMGLQREREDWPGLFRAAWDLRRLEGEDEEIGEAIDIALEKIREQRRPAGTSPDETEVDEPSEVTG